MATWRTPSRRRRRVNGSRTASRASWASRSGEAWLCPCPALAPGPWRAGRVDSCSRSALHEVCGAGARPMELNDYAFLTRWRVHGTVAEVDEVLADAASLPRWWPSVYLDVRILRPGDARGVGKTVELLTQGWLPYRLRWSFVTTERRPDGFRLEADGDFEGRGIWTFVQSGDAVDVSYDWRIRARKP